MKRKFAALASRKQIECDPGRMTIEWRTDYVVSTFTQSVEESEFIPLRDINRRNLERLLGRSWPGEIADCEL